MTIPNITGESFAREVLSIRPDIPVILFTGLGPLIDKDTLLRSGIRAVLPKPILLSELHNFVSQILNGDDKPIGSA